MMKIIHRYEECSTKYHYARFYNTVRHIYDKDLHIKLWNKFTYVEYPERLKLLDMTACTGCGFNSGINTIHLPDLGRETESYNINNHIFDARLFASYLDIRQDNNHRKYQICSRCKDFGENCRMGMMKIFYMSNNGQWKTDFI